MSEPHDFDDYEDDEDVGEEAYYDCGLMPDGQCLKAGSEECDWECPYSHGEFYCSSALWQKKHDGGVPVEDCECNQCVTARAAQWTKPHPTPIER